MLLQEMSEDVGSAVSGFGAGVGRVTGNMWGGLRNSLGRAAAAVTIQKASEAGGGKDGTSEVPTDAATQQAVEV